MAEQYPPTLQVKLLDSCSQGYLVVNRDWHLSYANKALWHLLDVPPPADLENAQLWDLVPEMASQFFTRFQEAFKQQNIVEYTGYYPPNNRWFDISLQPLGSDLMVMIRDVSQRQQMLENLSQGDLFWNKLFESLVEVTIVTDERGVVLNVNPAILKVFGYEPQELIGKNVAMLMTSGDQQHHDHYMQAYLKTGHSGIIGIGRVVQGKRKDNAELYLDLAINEVLFKDRRYYVGILRDVTQRVIQEARIQALNQELEQRVQERTRQLQEVNAELERMAMYDTVTGLANRGRFQMLLQNVAQFAEDYHLAYSVLIIDLNRFKIINDTLGHHVGDLLLRAVSKRIVGCVREVDIVARIGGDEFAILLEKTTRRGAEAVAGKIVSSFQEPFELDNRYVDCGCSVGVGVYPIHDHDAAELCKKADAAMYHAKEKNLGYAVYDATMARNTSRFDFSSTPAAIIKLDRKKKSE